MMTNATTDDIFDAALALPHDARRRLSERLSDSLTVDELQSMVSDHSDMLHRRAQDMRSGRLAPVPADEALARVRQAIAK